MTNQYARGRRVEYAVQEALEAAGYETIRSAGSKTKVDIVGIRGDSLVFVQCKLDGKCGPAERMRLQDLALMAGAVPLVAGKGRTFADPPDFRVLTGPGPKDWSPWIPAPDISGTPIS